MAPDWTPIPRSRLDAWIRRGVAQMTSAQARLWERIQVEPDRWQLPPWGDEGGGFWVVATTGRTVVWFNDIEEGFNRSRFTRPGVIDEYCCDQDELHWAIDRLLHDGEAGTQPGSRRSPPDPGA